VPTTLIVTEKPDAALHVAEALASDQTPRRVSVDGVPFFEVQRDGGRILVCSALGHLYAVGAKGTETRSQYPVWDFAWMPKHLADRGQGRQEKWIHAISKVSKEADRFVNACDFDIEGSLIGYTVLKYACGGADKIARRMKFSTLTVKELRDSYLKMQPELDFFMAFAGMCRHEVDWLYGINLSRALTQSAFKASKRYLTLSTGRVQGPTLRFVVDREREIETFVPVPYWQLRARVNVDGDIIEAEFDRFETKAQAEQAVSDCAARKGVVDKLESRTYQLSPPTPFDLSALQSEAYRHFGYSPRVSLSIAERLYLDQLISYPRTSSQKLPPSIGYEEILTGLKQIGAYSSGSSGLLASGSLRPTQGEKDDPAHPAIYPTGSVPRGELDSRGQKVFDLVVRRFLATFGTSATKQSDKATIRVGKHAFFLRGSRIQKKGWIALYGQYAKFEEVTLPQLTEGQEVIVEDVSLEEKYTQPPPRYNPSSLLKAMEEAEIGTKATRADIIETLYKRGYMKEQRISATPLAFRVTEILMKQCPKVIDVTFTRELETKMREIEHGKQTRENVVLETVAYLKPVIEDLKRNEQEVGQELTEIIDEMRLASVRLFVPCPQCGSTLKIVKNPKTKKRFIGCAGKWTKKCDFGLPLPQFGALKLLEKRCAECGFQLIQVRSKGRYPIISCPKCYVNKLRKLKPAETVNPKVTKPSFKNRPPYTPQASFSPHYPT
jgi:DNA topoisomerase-1